MSRSQDLVELVETLQRLRRRIAPPDSLREKLARAIYVPIVGLIPNRLRMRVRRGPQMIPEIVYLEDLGVADFCRTPIRRIVILKVDHIGDFIVGLRALRELREGFADAHITLVCASWNQAWAQRTGWFDRIVPFNFFSPLNRNWIVTGDTLKQIYESVAALPLESYDLAIDLRHDAETRPCLYRIDARYRAGFYAPIEIGMPYLDLVVPYSEGIAVGHGRSVSMHADLRLQMLAATVVAAFAARPPHPAAALTTSAAGAAVGPFAVIAIGAGDPIRCWPVARYAELGRALIARHGLDIVVLGGPAEQADAAALAAGLPPERVRVLLGKPLAELPDLMTAATLCVCNGSGMSHLAASLGVATVCVLGGTTRMDVWHPAGPNVIAVGGKTPCQPCGLREVQECPWDVACLTAVTAEHVLGACERLLAARLPPLVRKEAAA